MNRFWLAVAALGGALSLALGAVGRHAVEFAGEGRAHWLQAERYHQFHVLVLLALAFGPLERSVLLRCAAWTFLAGTLVFCGTLYARAAGQAGWLVRLTPAGGVVLIVAWLLLLAAALHGPRAGDRVTP